MANDRLSVPKYPLLEIIRQEPAGATYDEIRTRMKPTPKGRTLHNHLARLEADELIEHFADPLDGRKVRYRIRSPEANAPGSPASAAANVHRATVNGQSSPAPGERDHGQNAVESADDAESLPERAAALPDSGARQAQAFADPYARAVREVVRDVVLHLVPPQGVAGMARTQAAILHWNAAETAALIAEVRQVLPSVTPETASAYGLLPDNVLAWRSACAGADANRESETSNFKSVDASSGAQPDLRPNGTGHETRKAESRKGGKPANESTSQPQITAGEAPLIENPNPPRSAVRSPQFPNALTPAINAIIDRFAPDLAPELRRLLILATAAFATVLGALCLRYPWVLASVAGAVIVVVLVIALVPRQHAAAHGSGVTAVGDHDGSVVAAAGDGGGSPGTAATERGYNSRRRGIVVAALASVLVAGLVAGLWYWRHPSRPSEAAIAAYLTRSAAPLPVRAILATPSYTAVSATNCSLAYEAVLETTAPLYRRVDTTEYLRGRLPPPILDPKSQISDVGPAPTPAPKDLVLVTTATPPGTTAPATGLLMGWRRDGAWVFTPQQGGFDRSRFTGEPKPAGALAIDDPADLARLNAWLADQVAYAAKVQTAAAAMTAELERTRQQQSAAFGQLLSPGTLFTGTITDPVRGTPQYVVLEITASSAATQQLSIALRNDGGWSDARPFTATWALNAASDAAVVTLKSSTRDYVDSAGPLLQDRIDLSFAFELQPDGGGVAPSGDLKSQISNFKSSPVALRRVAPSDAAAVRGQILRPIASAIAATQVGKVYRGTATSRTAATTEPLRLRFVGGSDDPARPVNRNATLESTTLAGAVRPYRGTIVSNTYRVKNAPIQLVTLEGDRVPSAGSKSVLALATGNGIRFALRVDGDRLVGEDPYFTYEFSPETGANSDFRSQISDFRDKPPSPAAPPADPASGSDLKSQISNLRSLPPFPTATGAYVLVDSGWAALPHNNGNIVKSVVQAANGFFGTLNRVEDKLAGKTSAPSTDIVGDLIFSGRDETPPAPASQLVIAYVGPLALSAKFLAEYPMVQLDDVYSLMELAPLRPMSNGNRSTPMCAVFGGLNDFGPRRLPATVETAAPNVTVLRCTAALPAGHYALACGKQYYEVGVK